MQYLNVLSSDDKNHVVLLKMDSVSNYFNKNL